MHEQIAIPLQPLNASQVVISAKVKNYCDNFFNEAFDEARSRNLEKIFAKCLGHRTLLWFLEELKQKIGNAEFYCLVNMLEENYAELDENINISPNNLLVEFRPKLAPNGYFVYLIEIILPYLEQEQKDILFKQVRFFYEKKGYFFTSGCRFSLFHWAALLNQRDVEFDDFMPSLNKPAQLTGYTPLYLAIVHNQQNAINALLNTKGINVNNSPRYDIGPLYFAVKTKNLALVKKLLKAGAEVTSDIMKLAINDNLVEIIHEFIQANPAYALHAISCHGNIASEHPFHIAMKLKRKDIIQLFIDYSDAAVINSPNCWGEISLHKAIKMQDKDLVEELIRKGANIEYADGKGLTPLCVSLRYKKGESREAIAEILINHGASVSAVVHSSGEAPLHVVATDRCSLNLLTLMLNKVSAADLLLQYKKSTPLDMALNYGSFDSTEEENTKFISLIAKKNPMALTVSNGAGLKPLALLAQRRNESYLNILCDVLKESVLTDTDTFELLLDALKHTVHYRSAHTIGKYLIEVYIALLAKEQQEQAKLNPKAASNSLFNYRFFGYDKVIKQSAASILHAELSKPTPNIEAVMSDPKYKKVFKEGRLGEICNHLTQTKTDRLKWLGKEISENNFRCFDLCYLNELEDLKASDNEKFEVLFEALKTYKYENYSLAKKVLSFYCKVIDKESDNKLKDKKVAAAKFLIDKLEQKYYFGKEFYIELLCLDDPIHKEMFNSGRLKKVFNVILGQEQNSFLAKNRHLLHNRN